MNFSTGWEVNFIKESIKNLIDKIDGTHSIQIAILGEVTTGNLRTTHLTCSTQRPIDYTSYINHDSIFYLYRFEDVAEGLGKYNVIIAAAARRRERGR